MDEPQCKVSGSHVISQREGEPEMQYPDGTFVGYCQHCSVRIVLTFKPGGLDVVRLDELGARLLDDNVDPEAVEAFKEAYDETVVHHAEVSASLRRAEIVRQLLVDKYEADKGEHSG